MHRFTNSALALALALTMFIAPATAQTCDTGWRAGPLDNGTLPSGVDGTVWASAAWDADGAGPEPPLLVIAGQFTRAGYARLEHRRMESSEQRLADLWRMVGAD